MSKTMRTGRSGIRFIALAIVHGITAFLAHTSLAVILAQPRQAVTQSPDGSDRIQELRFPVAHHHAMSVCLGYLSITPDRITYLVRETDKDRNHSFDIPRSEVKMVRPWTMLNEPMNAAEIKFSNLTYHFWLVGSQDVERGSMIRLSQIQDPTPIVESIRDFYAFVEAIGGRLEISADTPGVQILLNGHPQGIADSGGTLVISGLKPGDYDVQLSGSGYTDFSRRVTLNYGQTERVEAFLERTGISAGYSPDNIVKVPQGDAAPDARTRVASANNGNAPGPPRAGALEGLFVGATSRQVLVPSVLVSPVFNQTMPTMTQRTFFDKLYYFFFADGHVCKGSGEPEAGLQNVDFDTLQRSGVISCGTYEIRVRSITFWWGHSENAPAQTFEKRSATSLQIDGVNFDLVGPVDPQRLR